MSLQNIHKLVDRIPGSEMQIISTDLASLFYQVRSVLPDKKRNSIGRCSNIKTLGISLYPLLEERGVSPLAFASELMSDIEHHPFIPSLGLKLMVQYALEGQEFTKVMPQFTSAASDEDWILREGASGLIRQLIKAFPEQVQA